MVPEFFNDKVNDRFILKLAQPFWSLQDIPHATDQVTDQVVNVTDQVTDQKGRKYLQNVMENVDRRVRKK